MKRGLILGAILAVSAGTAAAQTTMGQADSHGTIAVTNAWARATAGLAATGAIYCTVTATEPDRLTGAFTPVAATAALHQTSMDHGVMRMRPVDGLAVAPGTPVTLAPGGYHVMLTGLKQKLVTGESFPLTLTFQHAGAVKTVVMVERPGASGPAGQPPAPGGAIDMSMPMGGTHK
jgi:copper(I)-binding protein